MPNYLYVKAIESTEALEAAEVIDFSCSGLKVPKRLDLRSADAPFIKLVQSSAVL